MMENQQNGPAEQRENQIRQGYYALQDGKWQEAQEIFRDLLQEDPHCGMSCLGSAMAGLGIHSREELARYWNAVRADPDFQQRLAPAKYDFMPWLQKDMETACKELADARKKAPVDFGVMRHRLRAWLGKNRGRKLLLIFAGVQAVLFLASTALCAFSTPSEDNILPNIAASLFFTAFFTGSPIFLGVLYGRSIVEHGIWCRLWKILNNLVAGAGALFYGMISAAGFMGLEESVQMNDSDVIMTAIFTVNLLIHLVSMIFPIFLRKAAKDGTPRNQISKAI